MEAWLTDRGLSALVFIGFIAMTLLGALMSVTARRLIQSVIGLAACFFGLAGLIYYLHNPFVSLMVILIYVGAVCVTIVFGIMMAAGGMKQPTVPTFSIMTLAGLIAAGALFWALTRIGSEACWPAPAAAAGAGSVQDIGHAFLNNYCLAFELISLVLLVAILGAIVVARGGRDKPQ